MSQILSPELELTKELETILSQAPWSDAVVCSRSALNAAFATIAQQAADWVVDRGPLQIIGCQIDLAEDGHTGVVIVEGTDGFFGTALV